MEGLSQISNQSAVASASMGSMSMSSAGHSGGESIISPIKQEGDAVLNDQSVKAAIQQANQALKDSGSQRTVTFGYEEKLGQMYVQVRDNVTGSVVGEFPSKSERALQIAMREMVGMILDKQG